MRSVLNIVVAGGLILPSSILGQNSPPVTQTRTTTPGATSQPPRPTVNGKTSVSPAGTPQAKPQNAGTKTHVTGSNSGKRGPSSTTPIPPLIETPKKIVVRQGGVPEPSAQIVTDMDPADATRKREDSERLLGAADENLNRLVGRTLTEQQQETVSQIGHYMKVARSALKEGDISRGHTLALKANLLAADIAKH